MQSSPEGCSCQYWLGEQDIMNTTEFYKVGNLASSHLHKTLKHCLENNAICFFENVLKIFQ